MSVSKYQGLLWQLEAPLNQQWRFVSHRSAEFSPAEAGLHISTDTLQK